MNTLPEPKSIPLEDGGTAVVLPNGDIAVYPKGKDGFFLQSHSFLKLKDAFDAFSIPPLQFPELPEGEEWSNPDNLTPEQFEEGYRPLLKSEVIFNGSDEQNETCYEMWSWKGEWCGDWYGCSKYVSYRTKSPLPTPKAKEEPQHIGCWQDGVIAQQTRDFKVGQAHTAKFLQNCKTVVIESPLNDECPMGSKSEPWVFTRGECYGKGCINDQMEIDLYNGETKPLKNILTILPQ